MRTGFLKALVASTAISCMAMGAQAQTGDPEPVANADDAGTSGDVVVTAQKRSEKLRDVPLSVSAFSEKAIDDLGIKSIQDYASRSAGVRFAQEGTQSSISVRGISTSTVVQTTAPTAGVYIDDYPVYDTWYRFTSPDLRIFDVERIEVLRGPQGTLYGATSLSGSVRIITNKPDLNDVTAKFEGTASATRSGGANVDLNAAVNVPLIEDKLAIRAVGYARSDPGYVDNVGRGRRNVDDRRSYGGRFYVRAQPGETLNLLAEVSYQHDAQDDISATFYAPPPGRDVDEFTSLLPVRTRSSLFFATLSGDQELGGGNLTATFTYGENRSDNRLDWSQFAGLLGAYQPTVNIQPSVSKTKIAELRYTSSSSGPIRFVAGAYYNSRDRALSQQANQPALVPRFGTDRIYSVAATQTATELALFGEATWRFAPRWEATAGVRVFRNEYDFDADVSGLLNSTSRPLMNFETTLENNQSDYTPRFSLAYKPTSDVNLYATVSKGYRFGLTNYNSGASAGIPLAYKSDSLWNYEAGIKATLFGGRGTINTSGYYIDWSDIQLSFRNANNLTYTTNAGNARSYGVESEFTFHAGRDFQFNGAASLGRAEITEDNPGIVRVQGSIRGPTVYGIRAGDRLPGSSIFSASGGAEYTLRGLGPGDGFLRVDDVYVGPAYVDFTSTNSLRIGGYNLVNIRVGYRLPHVEVTAFVNNALNSDGIVNAIPNVNLFTRLDAAYRVRPRTAGLTVRAFY